MARHGGPHLLPQASRLFKGIATWGELLRTLGFATAPGILCIVGIIPVLGLLGMIAGAVIVMAVPGV